TVNYSHRHFANGELKTIYGGEDWMTKAPEIDSLGQAYAAATSALGFRAYRHEGKLTGLSALGKPIFAEQIGSHFRVDDGGRVLSDFRDNAAMETLLRNLAKGARREDIAASI